MKRLKVKVGDCFASLAKQHGFHDANIIYDDPANQVLRQSRPNMHVLQEGDEVCVPSKRAKSMPLNKKGSMTFTIKGQVTEFATVITDNTGNPLTNMPYELNVGTQKSFGTTDQNGTLSQKIDASAKLGMLIVFLDSVKKNTLTWSLQLGALPPHNSAVGIQARLNNLGYFCANEIGNLDDTTSKAITAFKTKHGQTPNAVVDDAFLVCLKQEYGF